MPMDWKQGGNGGATVAIAVLRVPAKVEVSDPRYGGAIIVNPGELSRRKTVLLFLTPERWPWG